MNTPSVELRRKRTNIITTMLEELIPIPFKKAVNIVSFNMGLSDRLTKEYINMIVSFKDLEIVDGVIQRKTTKT